MRREKEVNFSKVIVIKSNGSVMASQLELVVLETKFLYFFIPSVFSYFSASLVLSLLPETTSLQ